jgi:hypothetical protein
MRTIISHFWNEEYLLPWWIKHHREMFDEAVLINWGSTDRSVAEIRKHAPSRWKVVDTKWKLPMDDNACFAAALDEEVIEIESGLTGWRICLNTTEFLIGDIASVEREGGATQHNVGCLKMWDWNPEGALDHSKTLWSQLWMGTDCRPHNMMGIRRGRSIHSHPIAYEIGRHVTHPPAGLNGDMVILHYGDCISSPAMLKRRMQVQERITTHDRRCGFGIQHFVTPEGLRKQCADYAETCRDLRSVINAFISGSSADDAAPKCG